MCFSSHSMPKLVLLVTMLGCLLNARWLLSQQPVSSGKQGEKTNITVDARELSPESKAGLEKVLSDSVARAASKHWQELGIVDEVEVKFFADLHKLVKTGTLGSVILVHLIKPGGDVPSVHRVTFTENEKVALKYTCVSARVTDATAIVTTIGVDRGDLSFQEVLLRYTADGVWKAGR